MVTKYSIMSNLNKKIYIAGHRGLVGSAFKRVCEKKSYNNIVTRTHKELDLTDFEATRSFFEKEKPEWVFLAAAKVGGIYGNSTYPTEFLLENIKIQNNVLECAKDFGVSKLLFLGSSCIYPKECPQPIKESYLLSDKLEPTNEAYAIAKIAGIKLCHAMNQQYNTNFLSVMPSNLYGPNDNYHPENGHVLPMLLRRFHEAKMSNKNSVTIWGTGKPMREFLYSDDLADACLFLLENKSAEDIGELINIGTGVDCTILELAESIKEVVGYEGDLKFDTSKPDGTFRKVVDVQKINSLGWEAKVSLREGLKLTYKDFLENPDLRLK